MDNKLTKNIVVLDTSIATVNVGDEIIMDAVNAELFDIFNQERFMKLPTHEKIGKSGMSLIRNSTYSFVGGSNILSSYMNRYKQWKITLLQSFFLRNKVVLLGTGWRNYQTGPNLYTKELLNRLLNKEVLHSVRDSYTETFLKAMGYQNVINTACPTMWRLTKEHCQSVPVSKSDKVIFTLTDYSKDVVKDKYFIEQLSKNYEELFYFPQGRLDLQYLNELGFGDKITIVPPNLRSYNSFMENNECDYIGTRLHGGIRALQKKRRTLIIGVDNRALEKKADFNIPVLDRNEIEQVDALINQDLTLDIRLPLAQIRQWKDQFNTKQ